MSQSTSHRLSRICRICRNTVKYSDLTEVKYSGWFTWVCSSHSFKEKNRILGQLERSSSIATNSRNIHSES